MNKTELPLPGIVSAFDQIVLEGIAHDLRIAKLEQNLLTAP
jgi:hypothetical protein